MATGIHKLAVLPATHKTFRGVPVLATNQSATRALKTTDQTFKKVKATQTYGVGDALKFRVVIPFMRLIGKASNEDLKDLDIYDKHQALQSSIDKVKKAYQEYVPAAKAAQDATFQAVNQARAQAYSKATVLVQSYEEMIALAAEQADELQRGKAGAEEFKQAYLIKANKAITKAVKAQGQVLYTVNKLKAQLSVQFQETIDRDTLQKRFIDFVVNFEKNVVEACDKFGIVAHEDSKRSVAQAFIEGLMDVPGLKTKDIEYYLALISQEESGHFYGEMIEHFFTEMQSIIQSNKPITDELVEGIQYNGIHLVDFVDNLKDKLEDARSLSKQLKDAESQKTALQEERLTVRAELNGNKQLLNEGVEYTVGEFLDFIQNSEVYKQGNASVDRLSDGFAAVKELKNVREQIAALEKQSADNIAEFTQEVEQKEKRLGELNVALHTYAKDTEAPCEQEIVRKTQELETLEKANVESQEALKKLPEAVRGEYLEEGNKAVVKKMAALGAEINRLKAQRDAHRAESLKQAAEITRLTEEIALDKQVIAQSQIEGTENVKADLAQHRSERDRLTASTLKVSGTELILTGDDFGMIERREGKLHEALVKAREAQAKIEPLIKRLEELNASYRAQDDKIAQLKEDHIFTEGAAILVDGTLQLLPDFFTQDQLDTLKVRMEEQLDFAIDIGNTVHEYLTMKNRYNKLQALQQIKANPGFTAAQAEALEQDLSSEELFPTESDEDDFPEFPGHFESRRKPHVFAPLVPASPDAVGEIKDYSSDTDVDGRDQIPLPRKLVLAKTQSAASPNWLSRTFGPDRPAAPDYLTKGDLHPPKALRGLFGPGRTESPISPAMKVAAPAAAAKVPQVEPIDGEIAPLASGSDRSESAAAPVPAPRAAALVADPIPSAKIEKTVQLTNSNGEAENITLTQKSDGTYEGQHKGKKVIGNQGEGYFTCKFEDGSEQTVIEEEV